MSKSDFGAISRRDVLLGGAAALTAATFAGAQPASAAQQLRVMMAGGSWKNFVTGVFFGPFAKANDAEIIWKIGLSMEPIIMAEQRNPQWDLVHTGQTKAEQLGSMGLYKAWTDANLPNLKNIHPSFRYQYLAGECHMPYGLCVNTKQIKKPITSWKDLWDPAFKGKVAFPAWNWIGTRFSKRSTLSSAARPRISIPASPSSRNCSRTTIAKPSPTWSRRKSFWCLAMSDLSLLQRAH